jgi:phosphate uptake regulator
MTRETRKIQKVGGSTFSVSLPKSWAEARGLSAGSLVTVAAHPDDVLVVQPGEDDGAAERTVTIEHDDPERLEHVVRAAYAVGLDQLRIEATEQLTREQRRAVGRVTDALPGTTVVAEQRDHVVVRVLLDGEEVSVEQSVRQLAFVASSMHREALDALAGETPADAVDRGAEADRLLALVDRHSQRGLTRTAPIDARGPAPADLVELRATARELQQVAADAVRLGEIANETEVAEDEQDAEAPDPTTLGERAREIVERATGAVVDDAGVDAARSALADHGALAEDVAHGERALRTGDADYRLIQAVEHCRRTADHGAAIARLALRGALRRGELVRSPAVDVSVDEPVVESAEDAGAVAPADDEVGGAVPEED